MSYDVIVVGAGPAGSIAAHDCAEAGLKTLLLEKFALPRDKPCGGAVMYRGLHLLRGNLPRHLIEQRIHGLRFVLPRSGDLDFRSDKMIAITVFRDRFDEYLARRAESAGAELRESSRVTRAFVEDDHAGVILSDSSAYNADFIVGADGVNTTVGTSLGLRPARKDLTRHGLGMESDFFVGRQGVIDAMHGDPTILELIPVKGKVSYGWIFPKKEHLAVGIAGAAVHMYPLKPMFDAFCKKVEKRTGQTLTLKKRRTYFLGADGVKRQNVSDRVILVGDAAGFVDPMMGEGIAYAMKSGEYAASTIVDALERGKHDREVLQSYQDQCVRDFRGNFQIAEWAGTRGTTFAEYILTKAAGYPMASEIMTMVARGEIGYSHIPATVISRLPKELPQLIRRFVQSKVSHPS
jgi:geranylgeranyl reductase family protein